MTLTPQQRWQAFRARHLPILSFRQKVGFFLVGGFLLFGFVVVVLPYLLPLGGLPEVPLAELQDENGHFITINDEPLYYTHHPGEGDAVILLHGFGGSSVDWREVMPKLTRYDVYAVDLAGTGLSAQGLELDLSHQTQADRVVGLMDSLGIEKAHVVGHDMGGNIAVHFAQRHPEKTLTLTLVAPAMQYEATGSLPKWVIDTPFLYRWARILIRSIMPESTAINLRSAAKNDDVITDEFIEDSQRVYHIRDWDLSLLALARDNSRSALAKSLQSMNLPVLIVWGEDDRWLSPDIGVQLEADFPNAQRVTFPDVGHLPMLEAAEDFAQALDTFWQGQGSSRQ